MAHRERHRGERIGWLRAAVLGANDGIVSTASLVVGVAAAEAARHDVLVAGVAGLAAEVSAAWMGRALSVSEIPSSSRACAPRASWSMSCSATFFASSGSSPRAT